MFGDGLEGKNDRDRGREFGVEGLLVRRERRSSSANNFLGDPRTPVLYDD